MQGAVIGRRTGGKLESPAQLRAARVRRRSGSDSFLNSDETMLAGAGYRRATGTPAKPAFSGEAQVQKNSMRKAASNY